MSTERERKAIIIAAVNAIVYDITDRHGLSDAWDQIDETTQTDIMNKWFKTIEQAILTAQRSFQ